ncbi:MAG: hypothetical protein ACK4M9_06805 [Anaerobacillus sp.]|uniref:hypothetical protein n=1 Tax=Anaerobacillus sp. TaxID=1872506 RepID=UPI00391902BB
MMFLTNADLAEVTKKQYFYKIRAHYGIFSSLLLTQLVALAFSFMGTGQMGAGNEQVTVYVTYYTGNIIIAFTMVWAFISGFSLNSKLVRDGDFSFVTNRLTSNLSNLAFLLTATVIGGVTAMLASSLLKTINYFIRGESIVAQSYAVPLSQMFLGVIAAVLYVTLLGAVGYTVAILTQLNKLFVVLLPILFVGLLFVEGRTNGEGLLAAVFKFFLSETSLFVFAVKVLTVVGVLSYAAIIMSDKVEVRK